MRTSKSPLSSISWFRIVLDEAHIIRRKATTLFKTVSLLHGKYRWCLSGTPIQNRLDDVGALFCFIGVAPFDRVAAFRKYIICPFEEQHERRTLAIERLRLLFDSLCLRRIREDVEDSLPSQIETVKYLEFSEKERRQYEQTKKAMTRAIKQRVGSYDRKQDFGVFQAQMHLRLLCNHGTFQDPFSWTRQRNMAVERETALELLGNSGEVVCSSCTQSLPVMGFGTTYRSWNGHCRHVVCNDCTDFHFPTSETTNAAGCPVCHEQGMRAFSESSLADENEEAFFRETGVSSKMNALTQDVQKNLWRTKR
jgi:SWI/SNF-related matrix-associated actin-dependent regulator of chromatin subfamily A3